MTTANQLLNVLSRHQGSANGISADALARELGTNPRKVRTLVSQVREQGQAICAHPTCGYFVPVTPEELRQSCRFLESRAMKSLLLLSRMKQVSLPELLGQMKLNQA